MAIGNLFGYDFENLDTNSIDSNNSNNLDSSNLEPFEKAFPFGNQEQSLEESENFLSSINGNSQISSLPEENIATRTKSEDSTKNKKKVYNLENIRKILEKKGIQKNITEKINDNYITKEDKESVYYFGVGERKKSQQEKEGRCDIVIDKKTLGRKRKEDNTEGKHTRNNSDNIIKKCKRIFFQNLIIYVVDFINFLSPEEKFWKRKELQKI